MKSISTMVMWAVAILGLAGHSGSFARAAQAPEKEWTLMVFLNGDNNLDSFGAADMIEMQAVGSNDNMNIVVLRDTSDEKVSSKIYYIEKGGMKVVKDFGSNIDMGNWRNLVEFFKFAKDQYPARHYLLDVWNHGSGWERRRAADFVTQGISYDDNSNNHITTVQLGEAFREMKAYNGGKKIDIFGMDACLMEMAEVIYEVKDGTDIVLGSEDTEPADGWAYDKFLAQLANKPTMGAEELAMTIEREYTNSFDGGSQGNQTVQGSAVSTAKLSNAKDSLNAFLSRLIQLTPLYHKSIAQTIRATQEYYYSQYKDAIHFISLLKEAIPDAELNVLADRAIQDLRNAVVANFTTGEKLSNSNGFSIWIPDSNLYNSKKSDYSKLAWAKNTNWQIFIDEFLNPSKPILEMTTLQILDENSDGFVSPGEKLNLLIQIENTSSIEAQNVVVRIANQEANGAITPIAESWTIPSLKEGKTTLNDVAVRVASDALAGKYAMQLLMEVPGLGTITKPFVINVDPQYTVEPYVLESDHNYGNNADQLWTIHKPGARGIRVHFSRIATEEEYDFVWILDGNDKVIAKFNGEKDRFWFPLVEGDTVKIRLTSDGSNMDYGFAIDQIAYH